MQLSAIIMFSHNVLSISLRTEKGVVNILDAYCPHLGANMAEGGRVKGDCLECPFHSWTFRGKDGFCENIPYAEKGTSKIYKFYIHCFATLLLPKVGRDVWTECAWFCILKLHSCIKISVCAF